MKIKCFYLILLTLVGFSAIAQEGGRGRLEVKASGTTCSASDKSVLPFANVSISVPNRGDTLVYRQVSDKDGLFTIALPKSGAYIIEVTFIGMKPYRDRLKVSAGKSDLKLGSIYLQEESVALKEAVVSAKKTLVKTSIEGLSYEMSADPTMKSESLLDALRKVPLVTVDGEGKIQVKGSGNYRIFMNGKPSNLFNKDAKDILRSIPASSVKKIDVITDPGVKYDAEGVSAILNIVTEGSKFEGYSGSFGVSAMTYPMGSVNTFFTAKYGKFGITTNLSGNLLQMKGLPGESIRKTEDLTIIQDKTMSVDKTYGGFGNILLSYEVDSLNLFNVSGNFTGQSGEIYLESKERGRQDPLHPFIDLNRSESVTDHHSGGGELSVDFQHSTRKPGELLTLSYNYSHTPDSRDITTTNHGNATKDPAFPDHGYYIQHSKVDGRLTEHTGQVDYTAPFGLHHTIEAGAKYILRTSASDPTYSYKTDKDGPWQEGSIHDKSTRTNKFDHTYKIGAAYFSYQYKTMNFAVKAGARFEVVRLSAVFEKTPEADFSKRSFEWVPQVDISYNLAPTTMLKGGYNFRIQRPLIWHLNPFRMQLDDISITSGNPGLEAERLHKLHVDYSTFAPKLSLSLSLAYEFTDNAIESYAFKEGKYIHNTFGNLGKKRNILLSGYIMYNPTVWLQLFTNLNLNRAHHESRQLDLSRKSIEGTAIVGANILLPWDMTVTANAGVFKMDQGIQSSSDPSFFSSMGITKQLLDNKLTINLSVQNPFAKHMTFSNTTRGKDFEYIDKNNFIGRGLSIGIDYKFGQMKSKIAKTQRSIHNDDLAPKQEQGGGGSIPIRR